MGLTRQLRFSPRSEQSLDVTLSLNGVALVTIELKNPLTGQTVEDARAQYRRDRDPREPIFAFKRRTLVHFAVDTESVLMTTRLAGAATHFLPFDRGRRRRRRQPARSGRAGLPHRVPVGGRPGARQPARPARAVPAPADRGAARRAGAPGAERDADLPALPPARSGAPARGRGRGATAWGTTTSWSTPRAAARAIPSAGSRTGWVALHDAANERVFDSVIVVTDRVVLDQQLQDTVYQFEHRRGRGTADRRAVAAARRDPRGRRAHRHHHAAEVPVGVAPPAGDGGRAGRGRNRRAPHPAVRRHHRRGAQLAGRRGGDGAEGECSAANSCGWRRGGARPRRGREDLVALYWSMARRARLPNLSFFAFTATPKHKTLAVFGRDGRPAHRYTMRQAIEEGFILDVLRCYTTYDTYFKLLKQAAGDPQVERKPAARALARFLNLHPHNVAQKTEVMVEHFNAVTRAPHRGPGEGDGGDRVAARGGALQAGLRPLHPGEAVPPSARSSPSRARCRTTSCPTCPYTEEAMNAGIRETELPEKFATPEVPGVAGRREVPDGLRPAAAAHAVREQAARRHPGGADALAPEPHASPEGGHLRPRLRERPRRDPAGVQDLLRRRGDGRGGRSGAPVPRAERTRRSRASTSPRRSSGSAPSTSSRSSARTPPTTGR